MRLLLLPLILGLSACSIGGWFGGGGSEPTLAELDPVELPPAAEAPIPAIELDELAQVYLDVLAVTDDPEVRVTVLERLAGIEMLQAEAQLADGEPVPDLFDTAIDAYSALLEQNPDIEGRDRLLYQLSKAHDMTGDTDAAMVALGQLSAGHQDSVHYTEAQFRVAESHFSAGRYRDAEAAYEEVISAGEDTPYYLNALYMHGWSRFKQGNYRQSIRSYTETLDRLVPANNDLESLSSADQALVKDCFRVLAVVFSYLEGKDAIAGAYDQLGHRTYEPLLYQELGELYLKQERYRDSAETFRDFSRRYPDSEFAHRFHVKVIGIYERAGFRELIVQEKRDYVASYGVNGDYFLLSDAQVQEEIVENLTVFIEELATFYHALAQSDAGNAAENYRLAGDYYRLYIDSFPQDERVPEMGFLLAEARTEAGQHAEAVETFEWVAYEYPGYEKAADAGYAAIVGYAPLLESAQGDDTVLQRKVDSQVQFANRFGSDKRAPAVLNDAAASMLKLDDYTAAIIASATLLNMQPAPPKSLVVPAGLVMAHSYFELGDFRESANGYRISLAQMSSSDERREPATERLAASLYRQGELIAAEGDSLGAALQFERVVAETPSASFRRQAQFDAAQNYMDAGEYQKANYLLQDFQRRYKDDPLAGEVPLKLVYNFEQMGDWEAAAREMDTLLPREKNPERAREMLYLAAEYYEKAGNKAVALERYRTYANKWAQPLGPRMEAMNRLTELYGERGEPANRRFWLRKIQDAHEAAGSASTDRSLYLAARASSVFADDFYVEFQSVKLKHPVDKSLKKKRSAMDKAMQAYQKTNTYGVAEFSSLSTFRMGEIYRQLGVDLMESERPRGLDQLALEQYELLLEEQAYPFEEKAIAIHETNMRRSWEGYYDDWIKSSFGALAGLSPARYAKRETALAYSEEIY
jgi:TolA-binding protein